MTRKAKDKKTTVSGDTDKTMILSLDPAKHAFIKRIAEQADLAQPKVVNLILAKVAAETTPEVYIAEIKKTHAAQELKAIEEKRRLEDQRIQQLRKMLDD